MRSVFQSTCFASALARRVCEFRQVRAAPNRVLCAILTENYNGLSIFILGYYFHMFHSLKVAIIAKFVISDDSTTNSK